MPKWTDIIIHHSATHDDGFKHDWEAIRHFHKSWRLDGKIITPEQGKALFDNPDNVGNLLMPWREIGYHLGLERVDGGGLVLQYGRPLTMQGAHCLGMNGCGIGICVVGNFDKETPRDDLYFKLAELCYDLMLAYKIKIDKISPHR
jgi:hypothetical protein